MSLRDRMEEEERNARFEDERRAEREREHAPASWEEDWRRGGYGPRPEPPPPRDPTHTLRPEPPDRLRLEGFGNPAIGPDPVLLMVVQVPDDDATIGEVVQAVGRQAVNHGVTLMLWTGRPRRRQRRAMKLLFGRKLGKRLTP